MANEDATYIIENNDRKAEKEKRDMLRWTECMDSILISALLHQQNIGNQVDDTFTTIAMNQVVVEVREKTGLQNIDKDKVRNRIQYLKSNFNECYDLFKHSSGIAWSPITKMFDAELEVWEALIQAKPSVKKWMSTEINHYDQLLLLYGKDRATGGNAETTKEKVCRWSRNKGKGTTALLPIDVNTIEDIDQMLASNDICLENFDSTHAKGSQATTQCEANSHFNSESISISSPKKKKRRKSAATKEVNAIKESIENVAEALKIGNAIAEKQNEIVERTRQRVYSENEVYDELLKMGLDVGLRFDAYILSLQMSLG